MSTKFPLVIRLYDVMTTFIVYIIKRTAPDFLNCLEVKRGSGWLGMDWIWNGIDLIGNEIDLICFRMEYTGFGIDYI